MNKLILIVLISMTTIILSAQELTEAVWLTGEENTKIETYQKDGMWFGKIISSDNQKAKIGKDILQEFQLIDGMWKGKLYAAKKDKMLNAVIDPRKDELYIEVSAGIFKKQINWEREKD